MPVADRFEVLHGDHLADQAGGDQHLEFLRIGGVAHHVADCKQVVVFFDRLDNAAAVGQVGRHRFFEQDGETRRAKAIAGLTCMASWAAMMAASDRRGRAANSCQSLKTLSGGMAWLSARFVRL